MKKSLFSVCAVFLMLFGVMAVSGCQSVDEGENVTMETDLGTIEIDETGQSARLIEDVAEVAAVAENVVEEMPEDLPIPDNAESVNWAGAAGSGMLSYKIKGANFESICANQVDSLLEQGWSMENGVAVVVNDTSTNTLNNEGNIVSVTCSGENGNAEIVTVTMVKGPQ